LGLTSVRTIEANLAERVVVERRRGGVFGSMSDLAHRVGLTTDQAEALATAGAFDGFGLSRREALWDAATAAINRPDQLDLPTTSTIPSLPEMSLPEQLMADLWATGITRDCYPTVLIRDRLDALGVVKASTLKSIDNRTRVTVGGIVTHRQRPATAGGVTFINLEDETGMVNVICDSTVWGRHRKVARDSGGLVIRGMLERADGVVNILAERIEKLPLGLRPTARNFR
jgi:error-prone DNA polymerase